jgi:hypothetical protein
MMSLIIRECLTSVSVVSLTSLSAYVAYKNSLQPRHPPENRDTTLDTIHEEIKSQTLHVSNIQPHFEDIIQYIYKHNRDKIDTITYEIRNVFSCNEWRHRLKESPGKRKITTPYECHLFLDHEYQETDYQIQVDLSFVKDSEGMNVKMLQEAGCAGEEVLLQTLALTSVSHDVLRDFVNMAIKSQTQEHRRIQKTTKDTMNIFYYKKDYWMLLAKSPKRSLDTIYLQEGVKESLLAKTQEFFSPATRDVYVSFGIPYKNVIMIYGPPGTGKTSTIKAISSSLDCDLYVLPITKDMLDTHLVDALSHINEQEDKERIIVIEDVDTMFDDRKEGDDKNGITLQGFLNCLDGFTCMEGTMLFITANKPEVLDSAVVRSCRIDHKYELGYANEMQTREMFLRFFPDQSDDVAEFYRKISHKQYPTSSLQEFFFYNRKSPKILSLLPEFLEILQKNDPKSFELVKEECKNSYM